MVQMDDQRARQVCKPMTHWALGYVGGVLAPLLLLASHQLWQLGDARVAAEPEVSGGGSSAATTIVVASTAKLPPAGARLPASQAASQAASAAEAPASSATTRSGLAHSIEGSAPSLLARLCERLWPRAAALALLATGLLLGRMAARQWRMAVVCGHVLRARRIRERGLAEPGSSPPQGVDQASEPRDKSLMPSQQQFVTQFVSELLRRDHAVLSAKLLAVRGVWGSGKSTLIQGMFRALHQDSKAHAALVPVYLNAWREESADDLHYRVVSTLAQHPRVFACARNRLSPRLLNRLAFDRDGWWPWRLKELTTGVKAAWKGSQVDTEGNAAVKWELPAPLDFQRDLECIVSALLEHGLQLVLFVDEIERGSREAAQAMVVLLRRSFDLPGVHLVVPFVPHIMDAAVFNPVGQMGPELRAAAEAVLYADGTLRQQAMDAVGRKLEQTLQAAVFKAPAPAATAAAASATAAPPPPPPGPGSPLAAVGVPEAALHGMFSAYLLKGYLLQDQDQRDVLLNRMQEKYFGSMRMVPRPSAGDLAAFVLANHWLVEQAEPGLAELLAAAVKPDGRTMSPKEASDEVQAFFTNPGSRNLLAEALSLLIEAEGEQDEPFRLLAAGNFSVRSFEGEFRLLLDRFAGREGAWRRLLRSVGGPEGLALVAPQQILADVLAQAVVAAVAMLWLKMGDAGAGHGR